MEVNIASTTDAMQHNRWRGERRQQNPEGLTRNTGRACWEAPRSRTAPAQSVDRAGDNIDGEGSTIQILVTPIEGWTQTIQVASSSTCNELQRDISKRLSMPAHLFYLTLNGKHLTGDDSHGMRSGDTVRVHGRLRGGDGGEHRQKAATVTLTVANITHLPTAIDAILDVEGDIYCLQEHTLGCEQMRGVAAILRGQHLLMHASPSHRIEKSNTAGVAMIARAPRPMYQLHCRADDGRALHQQGRFQMVGCGIGAKQTITVGNVYGWTRGAEDEHQALRTDALIRAALEELAAAVPDSEPTLLVGDLNADLDHLPTVQRMLANGWTDLGGIYDSAPTCFATETSRGTRRDYALANPAALKCVIGFRVETFRRHPNPSTTYHPNPPQHRAAHYVYSPCTPTAHHAPAP